MSISHMMCGISLEARQELERLSEATAQIANAIILEDQDRQIQAGIHKAGPWCLSKSEVPYCAYEHVLDENFHLHAHQTELNDVGDFGFPQTVEPSNSAGFLETQIPQLKPCESDFELLFSDENYGEDDSPYLEGGVVIGTEFDFAQFQRDIDFHTASSSSTEVNQDIDSAPHNPVRLTALIPPVTKAVPKIDLLDAFSPENLKQDLLHCLRHTPPESQYTEDYLYHLAGEYARTIRFLCLQRRWSTTNTNDWNAEVNLLLSAINDHSNNFTLWPELDEAFQLIEEHVRSEDVLIASDRKSNRVTARREVSKQMKSVGMEKMKALEKEMAVLLTGKGLKVAQAKTFVKAIVYEDCDKNGALLLGTMPGFTEYWRRCSVSLRWSWTD